MATAVEYARPASDEAVARTADALRAHGVETTVVADRAAALAELLKHVTPGTEFCHGSSRTLDDIGFTQYLKDHPGYARNLREAVLAEPDNAKRAQLRRTNLLAALWLGSVHAVTEAGQLLTASASGSQLAAYANSAVKVVLVIGTNKVVGDLDSGMRRLREHSFVLEDARMKSTGATGSSFNKVLIVEREQAKGRLHVLLVKESLGF